MKIIFSRKGFDSIAGGSPSAVYGDGSLISLPIPEPSPRAGDLCYADVDIGGTSLGEIVEQLSEGGVRAIDPVHLDPDLRADARPRAEGWRPIFGQAGSAQGHLARQKVGAGDLFLFFGSFAHAVNARGRHEYRDKEARFHTLFGWLQVDEVLDAKLGPASLPAWVRDHPHARHTYPGANALYIAKPALSVPGASIELSGAGTFLQMHEELILTAERSQEGQSPRQSRWSLPRCFLPESGPRLTYHSSRPNRWRQDPIDADRVLLDLVHRGQEFVFDASDCPGAVKWAVGLIEKYGDTPPEAYGRRLLLMVRELHRLGYEKLRIAPGLAPSGTAWRCDIVPAADMAHFESGTLGSASEDAAAHYSTGQGPCYFGWSDTRGDSPTEMAARFVERFPQLAAAGRGSDPVYGAWFDDMLAMTAPMGLPYAYWDDLDGEWSPDLPEWRTTAGGTVPAPPAWHS